MFRKFIPTALFLAVCVLVAGGSAVAEESVYGQLKAAQYNEVWKNQFASDLLVRYDDTRGRLAFYSDETLTTFVFYLTRSEADSLARRIAKYQKWNRQATEKGVAIEKEIGTVDADFSGWRMGDEWSVGTSFAFNVSFFSQNTKVHQMVLSFPKLQSRSNEFDTHTAETLYFGWDEAAALAKLLQPGALDAWLAKHKTQKAVEEEFK
jgi:hypothetical protein